MKTIPAISSELLAAPSLPICRKHQPSPAWPLTDLPCVSGEQKGTTEVWEQRDKGTQHLRGEGKGQRLLTVRTPQGCGNSQANSVSLACVGKWGFTPGKDEAPALPPLSSL